MASADLPSPCKKPSYARTDDPPQRRDPTDLRGSLAEQARTQWAEEIKMRAFKGRAGVNLGYSTSSSSSSSLPAPSLPPRRPLGPSRTEPHLSFAPSPHAWQTSKDILDSVYAVPRLKRADELRPMWETGSSDGREARKMEGDDSGFFGAPGRMDVEREEEDGDGFDLDEAFGPAKTGFSFGGLLAGRQGGQADESQGSNSTTRTVTQRLKRAFEEEQEEAKDEDDQEMAPTDVEDEGDDQPGPLGASLRGAAAGRRTAGLRKGWGKTQSLPASAFESMVDF
ncbi:membrane protein [Rhodotorula toruloides]|uniref:Membrane protein n=1 Tax=Rhodotorula toruloides TaxID=5286 RepID=A0A511KMG2_RHOTO|nr:membrane protein [Rhodotorula toruloides]GEM09725.1 membrane protein [Rhodotorula toruloides]GEM11568.1 membrane protein [Rhodotorula toruloides]